MPFKLTPIGLPESVILDEISIVCRHHRAVAGVKRVNSGGAKTRNGGWVWFYRLWMKDKKRPIMEGWPDLEVWLKNGTVWLVEVKAPGEDLSPSQCTVKKWADDHGIRHFVIDGQKRISLLVDELNLQLEKP